MIFSGCKAATRRRTISANTSSVTGAKPVGCTPGTSGVPPVGQQASPLTAPLPNPLPSRRILGLLFQKLLKERTQQFFEELIMGYRRESASILCFSTYPLSPRDTSYGSAVIQRMSRLLRALLCFRVARGGKPFNPPGIRGNADAAHVPARALANPLHAHRDFECADGCKPSCSLNALFSTPSARNPPAPAVSPSRRTVTIVNTEVTACTPHPRSFAATCLSCLLHSRIGTGIARPHGAAADPGLAAAPGIAQCWRTRKPLIPDFAPARMNDRRGRPP